MRVAAKLAAVLMLATIAALALQTLAYSRSAQQRAIDQSIELAGPEAHAIGYAVRGAWRSDGAGSAVQLAATYRDVFPAVEVAITPVPPENAELTSGDWMRGRISPHEAILDDGRRVVETRVEIGESGGESVYVVVQRDLPTLEAMASELLRRSLGVIIALLVGAALLTLALGYRLVGVPVERLSALARRVADGDYSARRRDYPRDELGRLAVALDDMTDALAEADGRVREERRARTRALEQLRHADRLTTVGKLTSVIAHELGTPLNVVLGRAGMILLDPEDAEEAHESAEVIQDQARHMTTILRGILDFSRSHGSEPEALDADDIARHAVRLLEPIAEGEGVRLVVAPGPTVQLLGREAQVTQVLTNLIINAIDASDDRGRIRVGWRVVATEHARDTVSMAGEFVCFDVEDNGCGMDEETVASIFDAFFTTKGSGEGTGLGLSVIRQIVDEHRGWIDVESTPGVGTTFSVHFPLAAA